MNTIKISLDVGKTLKAIYERLLIFIYFYERFLTEVIREEKEVKNRS